MIFNVILIFRASSFFCEIHDDVIKWKHFPRNWPFVRGIHRSPVNSPHKGQWRGALMFSFICVWINDWVNNGEAGDLRRYRIHYDVTVMFLCDSYWTSMMISQHAWRHQTTWTWLYHHLASLGHSELTHWGRDKMAAIFQTTFSNAFYWMKLFKFRLRFHWSSQWSN